MKADKKEKSGASKAVKYIVCIFLCFLSIFPFYMLIINSTLPTTEIASGIKLLPGSHLGTNFKNLMNAAKAVRTVNVFQAMANSLIVTVPTVILQIYVSSLTAYAVTAYNFKLRNFMWGFIYAIMMIPTQVSIVGFIKLTHKLDMYGTYWPLIIPAMAAPTTVYFMKQYMETGLSLEIVEAARIDGSSEFGTFNRVVLPLLKPAMATQAIFSFVGCWNNLYTPSILLATEPEKKTMPMFVASLQADDKHQDMGMIYTGLLLTVIPILIMYFFLSKYIIAGVALGGVKE